MIDARFCRAAHKRKQSGQRAERGAAGYLRRRGLRLIASNFRCRGGEIDLVMRQGNTLVFVEVRFRDAAARLRGSETITASKRARIIAAATLFLLKKRTYAELGCRFDVVSVSQRHYWYSYEWIRDAFQT